MTHNNKKSQAADALDSMMNGGGVPARKSAPVPPVPSQAARSVKPPLSPVARKAPPAVPAIPKVVARPAPTPVRVVEPEPEYQQDDTFGSPADFPDQSAGDGAADFMQDSAVDDPMAAITGGGASAPRTTTRTRTMMKGKTQQLVQAETAKRTMIPILFVVGGLLLVMSIVVGVIMGTWEPGPFQSQDDAPKMVKYGGFMLAGTIPIALITLGGGVLFMLQIRQAYQNAARPKNRGRGR